MGLRPRALVDAAAEEGQENDIRYAALGIQNPSPQSGLVYSLQVRG
ncbi:hypothetical protein QO002_005692 [Pararhizobium capsulatum DSM 1112]|uniref:Uncharacterized protein n=1 Tax=Pararhizobium capsulatum DSM 1112 TaxID=1121113 RepID=A0ABU0BYZ8_9HYPH|nr:hypothetical protein [Pararhizobium capsulatum DSM 1112]